MAPRQGPQPKIGLALGSGSARGWAHIGIIQALAEEGIVPDVVCGCSIGAFVGAAYANGDLEKLDQWVSALSWQDVVGLLDVSLKSGLIKGDKLMAFFERSFVDQDFSGLKLPFAAVATDLASGREVWLKDGNVAKAVRASIALPGVFTPVLRDGAWLVDGGLVNPVPVSVCRALGADLVVAVDLGSNIVGRAIRRAGAVPAPVEPQESRWSRLLERLRGGKRAADAPDADVGQDAPADPMPSMVGVMTASINIMQVRIARSRLAGEPADVLLAPRLAQLGLMDYHRGREAIAEGRAAVKRSLPALEHALGR